MTFRFIEEHRDRWPVRLLCDTLEVSTAGYYAWRAPADQRPQSNGATPWSWRSGPSTPRSRPATAAHASTPSWLPAARTAASTPSPSSCATTTSGPRRPASSASTTDSNHDLPVADNLLDRQFDPEEPNERWVADITYIPTREGWLYLAAVEDLYSRRVVGWSMADHMESRLVVDALEMAVPRRLPAKGCWRTRIGAASTPATTTNASWPSTGSRAA